MRARVRGGCCRPHGGGAHGRGHPSPFGSLSDEDKMRMLSRMLSCRCICARLLVNERFGSWVSVDQVDSPCKRSGLTLEPSLRLPVRRFLVRSAPPCPICSLMLDARLADPVSASLAASAGVLDPPLFRSCSPRGSQSYGSIEIDGYSSRYISPLRHVDETSRRGTKLTQVRHCTQMMHEVVFALAFWWPALAIRAHSTARAAPPSTLQSQPYVDMLEESVHLE